MSTILLHQKKYLSAINMLTIAITRLPDTTCANQYYVINSLEGEAITLSDLYIKKGNIGVQKYLEEEATSRSSNYMNSYQTATYQALAGSDWFCNGGFRDS